MRLRKHRQGSVEAQVIILDVHIGDEDIVSPAQLKSGVADSLVLAISIWQEDETLSQKLREPSRFWIKRT